MIPNSYLEHGSSILQAKLNGPSSPTQFDSKPETQPFITLSREVCAGATTLGQMLLPMLNDTVSEESRRWVLLDKDLLIYALTKHELPGRLAEYLPEDRISEIKGVIGELMGLHPSLWQLQQEVKDAIVQLARDGHVIFVGRGAHLLTQFLPGGLHVRLVASKNTRIKRMMTLRNYNEDDARVIVEKTDQGRRRFVRTNFDQDIDDPHTYDLVINTDRVATATAAQLVSEALQHKFVTV